MKQDEAKEFIFILAPKWAIETGYDPKILGGPLTYAFISWMRENGHGRYLNFRSTMGSDYHVEKWLAEALQNWGETRRD